ncbi:MAG: DNA mismatch repair protein [Saprospiraceae bacterium]|nr:DNA mismatch repair protein [Saprospiraceae bacterium]
MMEYQKLLEKYDQEIEILSKRSNQISYLRLAIGIFFLTVLYLSFKTLELYWVFPLILLALIFIWLVRSHQEKANRKIFAETLRSINQDEIEFLAGAEPFESGEEFVNPQHDYTYDLDVFGQHSLFQFLNRTATYRGSQFLAQTLQNRAAKQKILQNQEAIDDLTSRLELRQKLRALGLINRDSQELYQFIDYWARQRGNLDRFSKLAIYLFPFLLGLFLLMFAITQEGSWLNYATTMFILNLIVFSNSFKKIKLELSGLDRIDAVIKHYGLMLEELETVEFKSARLRELREKLIKDGESAGSQLKDLAYLFNQLETVYNGMAVMLFSGSISYHLHFLRKIYVWKNKYANQLSDWIEVIAEFEMLSSLANFKFNNPEFAFPVISDQAEMSFKDLGHPLVKSSVRIDNDIDLSDRRFVILTGSNMSGKSTFLRSVGINAVLACAGSPVCASQATLYPFKVLVSMRVADSLAENESYFYAEVKRLKQITDVLATDHCLVLLDEILRGTNSDDKRNGTLEVIRRMVRENVYGLIATHDLEICKESDRHPQVLVNKCFEVEIRNEELYFDYKLRDGICVNQSATFLMKKTGII